MTTSQMKKRIIFTDKFQFFTGKHEIKQNRSRFGFADHANNLQVIYSKNRAFGPGQGSNRTISQVPDRILDAPELLDDYCE